MLNFIFIISFILFTGYIFLIIYYRYAFTSIQQFNNSSKNNTTQLSIIIPARNEEANIEKCIRSILQNNYPKHLYEIIVVDDHSDDGTVNIVNKLAMQNVKLILLKDFVTVKINSYKKKAIEVAIAQANGTLIITTDADCIVPTAWLQTIANFYEEKKPVFIAAPVSIVTKNRFIEIFQTLDFMALQGITAAVVYKKQMTMCNGANMAYERKVFYDVGGFAGIDNIASGDDMLLMHKIYNEYPNRVLFLKLKEVIVKTAAVSTIKQFINQRVRWASKADKYDDKRILPILMIVYFFNFLMFLIPIIAIFFNPTISIRYMQYPILTLWFCMLVLKTVVELFFLYPVASFFENKRLLWFFPLLQPFHIFYTIIAGWLGKFAKYSWKERIVK
ncbi:MAG: glycosyltransferase [Ferruginibacter sp.]|nr:glycosyltransferase [Ferruginibacter sp.]